MKFLLLLILFTISGPTIYADTINLTNGRIIYGKVSEPPTNLKQKDCYKVSFSNGGWLLIKKSDVKSVDINNKDHFDKSK